MAVDTEHLESYGIVDMMKTMTHISFEGVGLTREERANIRKLFENMDIRTCDVRGTEAMMKNLDAIRKLAKDYPSKDGDDAKASIFILDSLSALKDIDK